MQGNINFYAGETKRIEAKVTPRNARETVVINAAEYSLKRDKSGEEIEQGICDIEGDTVSILLGIADKGHYELKVKVKVGAETFIEKASIHVEG